MNTGRRVEKQPLQHLTLSQTPRQCDLSSWNDVMQPAQQCIAQSSYGCCYQGFSTCHKTTPPSCGTVHARLAIATSLHTSPDSVEIWSQTPIQVSRTDITYRILQENNPYLQASCQQGKGDVPADRATLPTIRIYKAPS